jgi:ABC-type Fe3+-hydroxamate transport system substrate-binding protein
MVSHTVRSQRGNTVVDALGRSVPIGGPDAGRRVVSLVPSETESVAILGGIGRLVGRTEYCIEPAGEIAGVPIVGGTKNVDVGAVIALAPDLVLANQEESSRRDVDRLIAAGLRVHVSFPRTLAQSVDYLASLAALLGLPPEEQPLVRRARAELETMRSHVPAQTTRVWVPIWNDPWMSFDARTFASDVLAHAGLENVMAERPRRYPLAADLGDAPVARVDPARDTRYPRMRLDEAMARRPDVVLLPDEPFRFTQTHAREIAPASTHPLRVLFVDGKDLFWYGVRATSAPARLRALVTEG